MAGTRPLTHHRRSCGCHCNLIQLAVFIAFYCDYVLNSMGVPILPTFLAKLDVSEQYIGVLFASKPAVQIFANAFAGPLVDQGCAKQTLLMGLGVLAVSTAVFGVGLSLELTPMATYACLLTARCVQGLSSAFIMSSGMTWIARTHTSASRGLVMGIVLVGIGAGAVSGAAFGGVLASMFGNACPFFLVTVLLLTDSVVILYNTQEEVQQNETIEVICKAADVEGDAAEKGTDMQQMWALLNDPNVVCINVLVFVGNCGMTVLQPTLPIYVHRTLGYAQFGQGLMWGAMTFMYLVSRPLSGLLAERLTKWVTISAGVASLGVGLCIVGSIPALWVVLFGICLIGVGVAFITTPCMPLLADVVEMRGSERYGIVYSMADISTSLGMIMGPLLGSLLSGLFSFRLTCQSGGLLCLSTIAFSTSLKGVTRHRPPSAVDDTSWVANEGGSQR
eukprot:GGOE01008144.1.p1 GENE.GGOE01008144.1~~GGOE01008144.1.p1  ORF type:complete len:476 (+),score=134.26 GGOE01008144.1:87-1430(+)